MSSITHILIIMPICAYTRFPYYNRKSFMGGGCGGYLAMSLSS